jgi:hypothetical protein
MPTTTQLGTRPPSGKIGSVWVTQQPVAKSTALGGSRGSRPGSNESAAVQTPFGDFAAVWEQASGRPISPPMGGRHSPTACQAPTKGPEFIGSTAVRQHQTPSRPSRGRRDPPRPSDARAIAFLASRGDETSTPGSAAISSPLAALCCFLDNSAILAAPRSFP